MYWFFLTFSWLGLTILRIVDGEEGQNIPEETAKFYEESTYESLDASIRSAFFADKDCMEQIRAQISMAFPEAKTFTYTDLKQNATVHSTETLADWCLFPVTVDSYKYRSSLRRISKLCAEALTDQTLHSQNFPTGNATKTFSSTLIGLRSLIFGLTNKGDIGEAQKKLGQFLHMIQSVVYRYWYRPENAQPYLDQIDPEIQKSLFLDHLPAHLLHENPLVSVSTKNLIDLIWTTVIPRKIIPGIADLPNFKPLINSRFLKIFGLSPPVFGILVDLSCTNDNKLDFANEFLQIVCDQVTDFHKVVALRMTTYPNSQKLAAQIQVFEDFNGFSAFRGNLKTMLRSGCASEKGKNVKLNSPAEGYISFANSLDFGSSVLILTESGRAEPTTERPDPMWRAFEALVTRKQIRIDTVTISENTDVKFQQISTHLFNLTKIWGGAYLTIPKIETKILQNAVSTLGKVTQKRQLIFDRFLQFSGEKTLKFAYDALSTTSGVHLHCNEDFTITQSSEHTTCIQDERIAFCYQDFHENTELRLNARVETLCYIQAISSSDAPRPIVTFLQKRDGPMLSFDSSPFKINTEFVLELNWGPDTVSQSCEIRKTPIDVDNDSSYGPISCQSAHAPIFDVPYFLHLSASAENQVTGEVHAFEILIPTLIHAQASSTQPDPRILVKASGSAAEIDRYVGIPGSTVSRTGTLECAEGCTPTATMFTNCDIRETGSKHTPCGLADLETPFSEITLSGQNALKEVCLLSSPGDSSKFAYSCQSIPITTTVKKNENSELVDLPSVVVQDASPALSECASVAQLDCAGTTWSRVIEGHYITDINYYAHPPDAIQQCSADLTKVLGKISIAGDCCARNMTIFAISEVSGFSHRLEFFVNYQITDDPIQTGLSIMQIILIVLAGILILLLIFALCVVLYVKKRRRNRRIKREFIRSAFPISTTQQRQSVQQPQQLQSLETVPDLLAEDAMVSRGSGRSWNSSRRMTPRKEAQV